MIYIQIVSEKAFCHSQTSMISLRDFWVAFQFVSNLLSNLWSEMVLYLKQPKTWPKKLSCLYKKICSEEDNFNIFWTSWETLTDLSGLTWHNKRARFHLFFRKYIFEKTTEDGEEGAWGFKSDHLNFLESIFTFYRCVTNHFLYIYGIHLFGHTVYIQQRLILLWNSCRP